MKDYGCFLVAVAVVFGLGVYLSAKLAQRRKKEMEELMSAILDKITATDGKLDAAIGRVQEDVDALRAEIQRLLDEAANRDLTPEEQAALDALQAKIDGLDPTVPVAIKGGKKKKG